MHCIVEGNPSPKVTWYLGDTKLPDKLKYADYDVTSDNKLRVPSSSLSSLFLCNCTNPLNSVAKLAKSKFLRRVFEILSWCNFLC